MSNYYWASTATSTYTSNHVPKSKKDELEPLKILFKKYPTYKKEPEKEAEKVEPVLFNPKDLVL